MVKKSYRTMDMYVEAGAYFRLLKDVGSRTIVTASKVVPKKEINDLYRFMSKVQQVVSRAEDRMFSDFPDLDNDAMKVFYGSLGISPRSELDAQVIAEAKRKADELFGSCNGEELVKRETDQADGGVQ